MSSCDKLQLIVDARSCMKDISVKRQSGLLIGKSQIQQAVLLRQTHQLFAKQVNKINREMRSLLKDIELANPTKPSVAEFEQSNIQREKLFTQGCDRLVKTMLIRNMQIHKTVDSYLKQYNERLVVIPPATIEVEEQGTKIRAYQSKQRIRPTSSKVLKQFSSSAIFDRLTKSKQIPRTSPPKIIDFQCKQLPKFSSIHPETRKIRTPKIERAEKSPEQQLTSQMTSSRTTILESPKKYFANFDSHRSTRIHSSNSCRTDGVEILKDRIKLLNNDIPVKVARQQGYRKKFRDPRPFTNFFI